MAGFLDRINPHQANWDFHRQFDADTESTIEKHIESLVDDYRPVIESINKGIKTTQHNYGRYMQTLSTMVPDGNAIMLYISASAMHRAGADDRGLVPALNILLGR